MEELLKTINESVNFYQELIKIPGPEREQHLLNGLLNGFQWCKTIVSTDESMEQHLDRLSDLLVYTQRILKDPLVLERQDAFFSGMQNSIKWVYNRICELSNPDEDLN